MRVLLTAYSCRSGEGSEPGQGWGWAKALAEAGHAVTVLTRPKSRLAAESALSKNPMPNLRLVYVHEGWLGRALKGLLGSQGSYVVWQQVALREARRLHSRDPFDVVHHVTFSTILPGSPMWRWVFPLFRVLEEQDSAPPAPRRRGLATHGDPNNSAV